MNESIHVCKIITTAIATVLVAVILSITAYNIVDRIELGHVGYTQTLTPTK